MDTIWFPDLSRCEGSKYKALVDAIRNAIANDHLVEGDKLPPVRELGWQLKVTPGTVARAYTCLTTDGFLKAEVGRGTFVAGLKSQTIVPIQPYTPEEWPDEINLLSPLLPDVGQSEAIRDAYLKMADMLPDETMMRYPSTQRERPARQAVMNWISRLPLGVFDVDDIVLTYGGQSAILSVFQTVLKGAKPIIFAEDLTYSGFRHAAQLVRADVVSIACDSEGLLPDALEKACQQHEGQILCTSPEMHNPTAQRTNLTRRKEIAEIARNYDLQIMEDNCYSMSDTDLPSYRALLPHLTWYVSSLSKVFSPSLRIGYVVAPTGRAGDLSRTTQYSHFGIAKPVADLATLLLNSGKVDEIKTKMLGVLRARIKVAVNILGGFDLKWHEDAPFLWLSLPRGWRAASFCRAAEKEGLLVRSADDFALIDGRAPHAIRISVNAHISIACYEDALVRLRRILLNPPDQIEI